LLITSLKNRERARVLEILILEGSQQQYRLLALLLYQRARIMRTKTPAAVTQPRPSSQPKHVQGDADADSQKRKSHHRDWRRPASSVYFQTREQQDRPQDPVRN